MFKTEEMSTDRPPLISLSFLIPLNKKNHLKTSAVSFIAGFFSF